jgi:hypothetical protein
VIDPILRSGATCSILRNCLKRHVSFAQVFLVTDLLCMSRTVLGHERRDGTWHKDQICCQSDDS